MYIKMANEYSLHENDICFLFPIVYNKLNKINGNKMKKRKLLSISKSFGIKKTDVEITYVMNSASIKKRFL